MAANKKKFNLIMTLKNIVRLAHGSRPSEQPKITEQSQNVCLLDDLGFPYRKPMDGTLPDTHYRVHVSYAPLPSIRELEKDWGKGNVAVVFKYPFTLHSSCADMDRSPGEKVFYVHDAGGNWENEEQIAWGLKQRSVFAPNGYRPATEQETCEFAKAHPELADFAGLGSFLMCDDGFDAVAHVWRVGGRRILGRHWFRDGWSRETRVLFVRK
ncbi:MAG TPA: hypothetical protein VFQ60_02660 [Patescibacteria group bacterium]|nr:hypothetical protein [Patescibacteria group bacterium]